MLTRLGLAAPLSNEMGHVSHLLYVLYPLKGCREEALLEAHICPSASELLTSGVPDPPCAVCAAGDEQESGKELCIRGGHEV